MPFKRGKARFAAEGEKEGVPSWKDRERAASSKKICLYVPSENPPLAPWEERDTRLTSLWQKTL